MNKRVVLKIKRMAATIREAVELFVAGKFETIHSMPILRIEENVLFPGASPVSAAQRFYRVRLLSL